METFICTAPWAILFALAGLAAWHREFIRDAWGFYVAMWKPIDPEDEPITSESLQKFRRQRVHSTLTAAVVAANEAGQSRIASILEDLGTLYALEAIQEINKLADHVEAVVDRLELPLPPEMLEGVQ